VSFAVPRIGSPEPAALQLELTPKTGSQRSNGWIAERLRQAASLLAAQGANPFRAAAYRRAGDAIEALAAGLQSKPPRSSALSVPFIDPRL
jgi:DNA polymerase/3'-5' exonuclease PolX